ncbi:MAG: manganese-dependent inorganic pyrophosphatase [Parolsenella sp.]|uniref:manganese-dependent inorganic pyrophosphatase n=1 Tax=unclassified Parolsenella TaxID=2623992 RepID=UPI002A75077A|nr:manganese-dependent inorganic pyrophosphatase [Parolsenella sp.]MCI5949821.1 manganese-dependent inorganic pyrophosphatase [Coriobacteriaceae bacterium]MDY3292187.1 manganese-dependent inorganic pyrophosphatase [Parolsenella sp.]
MSTVYVFGHQNPDNDAIMSAVVLAQLLNQVGYEGNEYKACALGALPAESAKLLAEAGIAEPERIKGVEAGQLVVLTDHNESSQSVEGLKDATVLGVVDHHRIGDFETATPLHYIALPWGSSCTIVAKLFEVLGQELTDVQAKLLLSAMMTDTLMLKSPTTTDVDRAIAAKLGEQLGVDPVKFGMEVFLSRPSGSFTAAEMVGNDIKMFEVAGQKLLIGQYETVDKSRALGMIDEIREAMRAYQADKGAEGIVLCLTDIMEEGSQVLFEGETAVAQKGLGIADEHDGVWMPGVLSRKKQVAAPILAAAE